jgi:hypothetical protein
LVTLELDSGAVASLDVPNPPAAFSSAAIIPVSGGIVEFHGPTIRYLPIHGSRPVDLALNRCGAIAADEPDQVWIVDCDPRTTVRRMRLDGTDVGNPIVLPFGSHPIGAWSHGIVVQRGDEIDRVDFAGVATRITSGLSWGIAADRLLRTSCDPDTDTDSVAGCSAHIIDIPTGATVNSLATADIEPLSTGYFGRTTGVAAPDRRHIVVASGFGRGQPPWFTTIDLATATPSRLPGAAINLYGDGVGWSADGRWLFYRGPDSVLSAWRIGDPDPIPLLDAPRGRILASA